MDPVEPYPAISFIVPVHNRLDCTRDFMTSFFATVDKIDYELILVDDFSSDGTAEYLAALAHGKVRIYTNPERSGYAKSVNRGAKLARGQLLGLLNNDLILLPGWLEPMLGVYRKHLRIGAVGNIQKDIRTKSIDHAGVVFDLVGLPDHYGKNYPFIFPFRYREFAAVTGACMMIRRRLFLEQGGFDERYYNGCEDIDLCLRLGKKGYRHVVAGKSAVLHHVSASPGRRARDKENNQLLLITWGRELRRLGQKDWPFQYLMRYWNIPWRYNGPKLIDAILRLLKLKGGDSKWAISKRAELLGGEKGVKRKI